MSFLLTVTADAIGVLIGLVPFMAYVRRQISQLRARVAQLESRSLDGNVYTLDAQLITATDRQWQSLRYINPVPDAHGWGPVVQTDPIRTAQEFGDAT